MKNIVTETNELKKLGCRDILYRYSSSGRGEFAVAGAVAMKNIVTETNELK
jgi:hypothetical protein